VAARAETDPDYAKSDSGEDLGVRPAEPIRLVERAAEADRRLVDRAPRRRRREPPWPAHEFDPILNGLKRVRDTAWAEPRRRINLALNSSRADHEPASCGPPRHRQVAT
jgi:hypothetical protein